VSPKLILLDVADGAIVATVAQESSGDIHWSADSKSFDVIYDHRGIAGRTVLYNRIRPSTLPGRRHSQTVTIVVRSQGSENGSQCAVKRRRSSVGAIPTRQGVAPAGSKSKRRGRDDSVEAFDGKDR